MKEQDFTRWVASGFPTYQDVRVTSFVSVKAYFEAIRDLLKQTKKGDDVFFSDWEVAIDQDLGGGDKLSKLLEDAIGRGVRVRALFDFDQKELRAQGSLDAPRLSQRSNDKSTGRHKANLNAAKKIIDLRGDARLDYQARLFGSHHQKLFFVTVDGTLHGFCGGMDIDPTRLSWHDVQCKIEGAAAAEILTTLLERWDSLTAGSAIKAVRKVPSGASPKAKNHVQFARTYGKEDAFLRDWEPKRAYAVAGEFGVHGLLLHAIKNTERFIYVEDQYFFYTYLHRNKSFSNILEALNLRLRSKSNLTLTILTPRTDQIEGELKADPKDKPQVGFRRKQLFDAITAGVSNVDQRVWWLNYKKNRTSGFGKNFVHSKTWIFDDEHCVIGSANFNRRGMTHDGEFAVAISSRELFARKLRIQIFLNHLNHSAGATGKFSETQVSEMPKARDALVHPDSPLERYAIAAVKDTIGAVEESAWNGALDPEGTGP